MINQIPWPEQPYNSSNPSCYYPTALDRELLLSCLPEADPDRPAWGVIKAIIEHSGIVPPDSWGSCDLTFKTAGEIVGHLGVAVLGIDGMARTLPTVIDAVADRSPPRLTLEAPAVATAIRKGCLDDIELDDCGAVEETAKAVRDRMKDGQFNPFTCPDAEGPFLKEIAESVGRGIETDVPHIENAVVVSDQEDVIADNLRFNEKVSGLTCRHAQSLCLERWNARAVGKNVKAVNREFKEKNWRKLGRSDTERKKKWETITRAVRRVFEAF